MPAEERPNPVVPTTFVPQGTRIRVKTGQSWVSIAKDLKIDPWDLIEFNFPGTKKIKHIDFQRACRNVNWYLHFYVGCEVSMDERRNFAFTTGLTKGQGAWKGGHIYIPPSKPSSPPPPPPPLWPSNPLPGRDWGRFLEANAALLAQMLPQMVTGNDPRAEQFVCWAEMLTDRTADDRVIEWPRIYPNKTGPLGAIRRGPARRRHRAAGGPRPDRGTYLLEARCRECERPPGLHDPRADADSLGLRVGR